jgi:hypothetical protein
MMKDIHIINKSLKHFRTLFDYLLINNTQDTLAGDMLTYLLQTKKKTNCLRDSFRFGFGRVGETR